MRRLKKLTVAVLTVALMLTPMTAVFAADSATVANADKATTLKDLALYSGQDANDPKVGLENALTTQDSLIFLSKLFGYNDAANALTADQVAEALAKFDDAASISDYAKNVVAYSATNNILSGSTKDGKFFVGAKDTVTADRFATFMLKQMGYSVADYRESVTKLAETEGSKVDATVTGDLIRDDAVGVMYGALTAQKASGKTVIADILGNNSDLKAKAEKLGLIVAPVVTDLAIDSVKALNPKQLQITFNQEITRASAQNQANYEIKYETINDKDVKNALTDTSCKLGNDNKTVTITFDSTVQDCLKNPSKAKVKISKNVRAINGKTLDADKEVEVEIQDGIIPTVTEVKATGERNIKITFSEPVYEGENITKTLSRENFKVVSGTYEYFIQGAELNLNVVNLELGTKMIEGPVKVTANAAGLTASAIQDYAGYKVFKGDYTFDYVKDTSVPVVNVKYADRQEVVLGFSKPVKGSNIKLYHSVKNAANYVSEVTTTGYVDEVTFTFDNLLPKGTVKLFLVNPEDNVTKKLIDGYGIKVPDQTLTCEVVAYEPGPTFTGGDVNGLTSITLSFDKELDKTVATNPNNYILTKCENNEKIPFYVKLNDSKTEVELQPINKLDESTEYKVLIKKLKDTNGNESEDEAIYTFTTEGNLNGKTQKKNTNQGDPQKVTIKQAQLIAKNQIKVLFDQKMKSVAESDFELAILTTPPSTTSPSAIRIISSESSTNSDGKTEALLTLDNDLPTDAKDANGDNIYITTIANPSSQSLSGAKLKANSLILLEDVLAPEIVMWDHDNDPSTDDIAKIIADGDIVTPYSQEYNTGYNNYFMVPPETTGRITLFFSEAISELSLDENTFEVDDNLDNSSDNNQNDNLDGFTITNITTSADNKMVILEIESNTWASIRNITVTQNSLIYDMVGNELAPASTWEFEFERPETE